MNKGIAKAKGNYYLFLNSGDTLYNSDVLANLKIDHQTADIICGQAIRADNGELLRHYDQNIVKQLILDTLNHQATLIKKNLFDTYTYREDYKIVSDWIAWIEWIIKDHRSVRFTDIIVAVQDMQGISNSEDCLLKKERKRALIELFGESMASEIYRLYTEQELVSVKRIVILSKESNILFLICRKIIAIFFKLHQFK